jgi:hypothetical protein
MFKIINDLTQYAKTRFFPQTLHVGFDWFREQKSISSFDTKNGLIFVTELRVFLWCTIRVVTFT